MEKKSGSKKKKISSKLSSLATKAKSKIKAIGGGKKKKQGS